jgi:signal transduction histidine kinase
VVENKRPLILSDLTEDSRSWWKNFYRHTISYIGLPMRVHDQVLGVLSVSHVGRNQLNLEEMTLLSFIADHLGLVVENARLRQQAERSAVMEERSRLARELHDSVTQSLYSATLFADSGRRFLLQGDLDQVDVYLSRLGQINQQALKDMRLLVYELRSPELHLSGLAGALHQRLDAVEHRSGVQSELQIENMPSALPEKLEEALYRVALEALNNALKHAAASKVWIRLHRNSENHIIMEIEDNGKGFIPEEAVHRGGMGLTTMRERVERLGGELQIDSIPGSGSCITASIPFKEASK